MMDSAVTDDNVVTGVLVAGVCVSAAAYHYMRYHEQPDKHPVNDFNSLQTGDRISYKCGWFETRHAILTAPPTSANVVHVIYLTGRRGEARVTSEDVDLGAVKSLRRWEYKRLARFDRHVVVARARSLCEEENPPERHSVIHSHWKFFSGSRHFADWCQTGLECSLAVSDDACTYTFVRHVDALREGDHICYRVGFFYDHGIVVEIFADSNAVKVARFHGSKVELKNVPIDGYAVEVPTYRCDYDFAIGDEAETVRNRALTELDLQTSTPSHEPPYRSGKEFAMWCKTQSTSSEIFAVASSRLKGRVRVPVQTRQMLNVGDHVAYYDSRGKQQHGIVASLHFASVEFCIADADNDSICKQTVDVGELVAKGYAWKYFYDVSEWNDVTRVVDRAEQLAASGTALTRLPFKNAEHFATWCKTSSYQIHRPATY